jgi:hypothetical protein
LANGVVFEKGKYSATQYAKVGRTFAQMRQLISLILWFSSQAPAANPHPQLFFEYGHGIDAFCDGAEAGQPEWVNAVVKKLPLYARELERNLPAFQKAWDKMAPYLLGTAVQETGKVFSRKEYTVSLFLCPTTASLGSPLQVNVLYHLMGSQPGFLFAALVFHELGHKYVTQIQPPKDSALIRTRFANEDPSVKAHLHLYALQKRVWTKLGLQAQLPEIQKRDARFGSGYTRAWQIVDTFGEEPFLKELRQ